ncbi:low molecular weight phosphatase family protein [Litorimonas sp. RW-G-Af-16]|uniref:arsenate-mycothiol transferase ArsC n=1 Tax=Litorimonas sp. RW-G-Af-16 TaxID=3241168 RepID=UPI00390C7F41
MAHNVPQSILFVCQLNSVRSPMAAGLMRKHFPSVADIRSCGLASGDLDDFMVTVMREKGVDMTEHEAASLARVQDEDFDIVIAFTPDAFESAQAVFEDRDIPVELWAVPDPGEGSLDVRALLNNYRAIRDNIETRLRRNFAEAQ